MACLQVLYDIRMPEHPLFQPDLVPICMERFGSGTQALDVAAGPEGAIQAALACGMLPHMEQMAGGGKARAPHAHARVLPHVASPTVADYARAYRQGNVRPARHAMHDARTPVTPRHE